MTFLNWGEVVVFISLLGKFSKDYIWRTHTEFYCRGRSHGTTCLSLIVLFMPQVYRAIALLLNPFLTCCWTPSCYDVVKWVSSLLTERLRWVSITSSICCELSTLWSRYIMHKQVETLSQIQSFKSHACKCYLAMFAHILFHIIIHTLNLKISRECKQHSSSILTPTRGQWPYRPAC